MRRDDTEWMRDFEELDPLFFSSHSPTDDEISEIVNRFIQGELTNIEAEAAFERLRRAKKRVLPVVMDLCQSPDRRLHSVGAELIAELQLTQAKKPLQKLLADPALEDEHKLFLLRALEAIGGFPLNENPFLYLRDPARMARKVQETFFEIISDPLELARLLEEQLEGSELQPLFEPRILEEIAFTRDRRALLLFQCLLHAPQDKVVLKAIEGLQKIGDPDVIPILEERSAYDPSPQVRRAAQEALSSLSRETSSYEPSILHLPVTPPSVERCALSTIDGRGMQMCILLWQMAEGGRVGLNVLLNDENGIQDCIVVEGEKPAAVLEEALNEEIEMAGSHVSLVEVNLAQARNELERAYRISLHARRRLPPGYIALRDWLRGEDKTTVTPYPLPPIRPEEVESLLPRSPELFQLVEFSSWLFEFPGPEAKWRRYGRKFLLEKSEEGRAELITQALIKVLSPQLCARIKQRLERQAWLLAQIYEDVELPKMALAASAALEPASEVPPLEHPFLREMMRQSLELTNIIFI